MPTKKAPTEKVAAKPVFKEGQKITHAKFGAGKIVTVAVLGNGTWLYVEFGDKKKSRRKSVRPSTVAKA